MPPDDTQTANRCRDALRWITTLPEDSVQVRVNSGRVTLEGTVRREHEREAAAEALRQVEGVVGVDNRLDVQ